MTATTLATTGHDAPPTARLLTVDGLAVSYRTRRGDVHAVRDVSLHVDAGETVAVVGESGSGKSTTAAAVVRLLAPGARIDSGRIDLLGHDLATASPRVLRTVRGALVGLVPQDPTVSLNPVKRIGEQVAEVLVVHGLADRRGAALEAVEALRRTGLPEPEVRARQYPHELSGGMRQRAMIAMALLAQPELLLADEPTTALDATIQAQILALLRTLQAERALTVLIVTHDLGVVAAVCDDVLVMKDGRIVETGPVDRVFAEPQHPYTKMLLAAAPVAPDAPEPREAPEEGKA